MKKLRSQKNNKLKETVSLYVGEGCAVGASCQSSGYNCGLGYGCHVGNGC